MPSVEEAATPKSCAIATNILLPYANDDQLALTGNVRVVQVVPFAEEAAEVEVK